MGEARATETRSIRLPLLGLALRAQNLLHARIEPSNPANDFFGNFAFDVLHPIGINGRYVHARVSLTF